MTVEAAELTQSGKKEVEGARKLEKILTFDSDGNLVADKAYLKGEAIDARTYSFIERKKRAAKTHR
ncbi:MAG TPA: hypothetical protein VN843_25595 [Anaerolineales bacterium]|nr:hypothetical protein [Anaerolineales bacterium]